MLCLEQDERIDVGRVVGDGCSYTRIRNALLFMIGAGVLFEMCKSRTRAFAPIHNDDATMRTITLWLKIPPLIQVEPCPSS
jgi:hypothetical protein